MTFSRKVKDGSMRQVMTGIFNILRSDDEIMRLLVYSPKELYSTVNIVELDADGKVIEYDGYWELVDKHIFIGEMSTKIEEEAVVRLYIHPGRRRPVYNNYILAKQEVVIDVLIHESFSKDMRLEWINDRINELLALEHVQGAIGKLDYAQGNDWVAPIGYTKYQHTFVFGANKK